MANERPPSLLLRGRAGRSISRGARSTTTETTALRLAHECHHILRRFRLHAGLLQEAQITEPIHVTILPSAERDAIAVCQPATHAAAVGQRITGMTAIAV